MNILINLSTLKKGGGQNVALNFLHSLIMINDSSDTYYFLVVENSQIHNYLENNNQQNILLTSPSPVKRVFNEIFKYSNFIRNHKIDVVYTYFGYGMFAVKTPQICGVAVSNVFFPKIKFWEGNHINIFIKKLIDKYRVYGIKKAAGLIFENKLMEKRSHSLFKISNEITTYIPPTFNPDFDEEIFNIPELNVSALKLLMLCGWQLNKNIMRVPEIAYYLKNKNINFQFIITAPKDNSKIYKEFLSLSKQYNIQEHLSIIGPVRKKNLKSLYEQIDFVLLMSKLESFSNNIIEAWHFQKPLIISDEDWARSICGKAAYYIDRESPEKIADSIQYLQSNINLQNELISEGIERKKDYPSVIEKTKKEIAFVKKIFYEYKS